MTENGEARVAAALGRLGTLGDLPVREHVPVFEEALGGLEAILASADDTSPDPARTDHAQPNSGREHGTSPHPALTDHVQPNAGGEHGAPADLAGGKDVSADRREDDHASAPFRRGEGGAADSGQTNPDHGKGDYGRADHWERTVGR
ncbi:hypothetical protein Ssi03_56400 [Sphaerisporangium siamense]|uniref:Uncharacterized protein n=1 Tax=Sphaerisporangium siamense TaxID=795645 RepID=A0A7W7GBD5_9ACTN|nr:hypothetical protein [Sphaerisporangium siamense]MBB4703357.1 hypothetical protein [Sphaerisporangium siamense]GII87650.1 hypothetical protein Ssi03_56400 [Sphaerisporangium siamense]